MDLRNIIKEYQLLAALLLIAAFWAFWQMRFVLVVLFGAYIIASAILPVVNFLDKWLPRFLAVILVFAALAAVVAFSAVLISGPVVEAWGNFTEALPLTSTASQISSFGIDIQAIYAWIASNVANTALITASATAAVFTAIIVSIYLSYDWYRIRDWLSSANGLAQEVIDNQSKELGAWARGQIILSALVGILVYAGLQFTGIPYSPALALAAAILELVPYAGPIIAAIPAIMIAYGGGLQPALIVGAMYLVIQQIEGQLLVPLIMQRVVYIHPVVIIAAILVGFTAMDIIGAFLAVPFVSLLWSTYKTIRFNLRE